MFEITDDKNDMNNSNNIYSSSSSSSDKSKKYLLNGVDMFNIVEEEWDQIVVELKLSNNDYINNKWNTNSWLTLISHGTVAIYLTAIITSMKHLSEYGSVQLSEDIHYLMNVTSAMGVITSPMLQYMYDLTSMQRKELQQLSDQSEKDSRPTLNEESINKGTISSIIPRGLLLKICKMRGILTTF
jgi:hypothetical protein